MSLNKYTPPTKEKEEKRRCCFTVKWDLLWCFLFLLAVGTCCQGVKDTKRINDNTENIRNENKSRP